MSIRPRPDARGPAYDAPERLIPGLTTGSGMNEAVAALGAPDVRGNTSVQYAVEGGEVNIWFAPNGVLGALTAMLPRPRRRR